MNIDQQVGEIVAAKLRELLPVVLAEMRDAEYDDDDLVDTREAARITGMSRQFFECGRSRKDPRLPSCVRIGRAVRYRVGTLREWKRKREERA